MFESPRAHQRINYLQFHAARADKINYTAPTVALQPSTRLGPYEIVSSIGAGGMGEVYRARDTRLDRTVAIKVLPEHLSRNPQSRERFEREAKAISSLSHPHICPLYDVGHQDGIDFLVMEYLEGETLAHRLKKGPLALAKVLRYAVQITDALDTAHRRGVIHRDLKPGNIMLTKTDTKLLDFGLAKMRAAEATEGLTQLPTETTPLTVEGTILGTLQYMAPEQLEGREADTRTDIFALGTIVYEMATGKKAFEGASRASLIAAIMEHPAPSLTVRDPSTPPVLDRVVTKCLAKDPDGRWQSARDLKDELEWIAGGNAVSAVAVTLRGNQARLAWAVASVVAMIAMVLAFLHFSEKPTEMRAVRFSVLPPENTTFGDPLAISPDGSRLALIASTPGKEPSLWVRRLDSITAQSLTGTEGADDPFWSPDGQFIAFFAQGKLKKIDFSGGPAQTLCDIGDHARGTWNRDGVIVFTHNDALYRVPAEGGMPTPLSLDRPSKGTGDYWPQFLPDGRHFLYQTFTQGLRNDGIYVGSLDSPERKRLLDSHWMCAYAPALGGRDAYLLFIRDGILMAQRFDANRLQLTGKSAPLAEKVTDLSQAAYFSVSANGTLAYRTAGAVKSQLTWFDRAGKRLGTAGLPVQDLYPALSSDGRRLAVSRADLESGNSRANLIAPSVPSDIWVLDLVRGTSSRLTLDSPSNELPVWSPDGSRIAFGSNRDGKWDLYQKASSGTGSEELLLKSVENKFGCDWSSDGRFLAYASFSPTTGFDQWVLPLDGDRKPFPFVQTPFGEGAGKFSPDGHWMAYQSDESGQWEVYVRPFSGIAGDGNQAPGGKWPISTHGGTWVHWRGDGKELFYLDPKGRMMAVEVKTGVLKGKRAFEASVPKPLFDTNVYGLSPYTVTADGQRFLINTQISEEKSQYVTVVLNWAAGLKP